MKLAIFTLILAFTVSVGCKNDNILKSDRDRNLDTIKMGVNALKYKIDEMAFMLDAKDSLIKGYNYYIDRNQRKGDQMIYWYNLVAVPKLSKMNDSIDKLRTQLHFK